MGNECESCVMGVLSINYSSTRINFMKKLYYMQGLLKGDCEDFEMLYR